MDSTKSFIHSFIVFVCTFIQSHQVPENAILAGRWNRLFSFVLGVAEESLTSPSGVNLQACLNCNDLHTSFEAIMLEMQTMEMRLQLWFKTPPLSGILILNVTFRKERHMQEGLAERIGGARQPKPARSATGRHENTTVEGHCLSPCPENSILLRLSQPHTPSRHLLNSSVRWARLSDNLLLNPPRGKRIKKKRKRLRLFDSLGYLESKYCNSGHCLVLIRRIFISSCHTLIA